jgi:peptidoglycan/xylan/chitin deacetylase (PgdA/CDA1 family)
VVQTSSGASDHSARPNPDGPVTSRRKALLAGVLAGSAGLAIGAGVGAGVARHEDERNDVVTEDDLEVGSRNLRNAIELADSTNRGRGMQRTIWSVPTSDQVMALTFDDGPDPAYTPRVLDILDRYSIKANFNVMGWNAEHHPDLVARHVARGDELGNHTYSHLDLAFETSSGIRSEIGQAKEIIDRLAGHPVHLFRPPRGVMTGDVADYSAEAGYEILLWTVIVTNPVGVARQAIVAKAQNGFGAGSIVSMHDGIGRGTFDRTAPFAKVLAAKREQEIDALPAVIEAGLSAGFEWVTVSEMLAATGQPAPGSAVGAVTLSSLRERDTVHTR